MDIKNASKSRKIIIKKPGSFSSGLFAYKAAIFF
jgi:hypothetical protein